MDEDAFDALADALRERLIEEAGADAGDLNARIRALVDREAPVLDSGARAELARRVAQRAFGLGALEPLLADPHVDEIMVNGAGSVFVERRGRIEDGAVQFAGDADLRHAIERILAPLGRRVDEASPMCDARLPDGSACPRRRSALPWIYGAFVRILRGIAVLETTSRGGLMLILALLAGAAYLYWP